MPLRTSEAIERIVVAERRLHPTWGPKKLRAVLERQPSIELPPAISTLGEILKRHGMIEARRRRPGAFDVPRGDLTEALRPNHVWATDFQGWFGTMKAECGKPASATGVAQQKRFDRWRKEFNEQRPHEAIGQRVPADVYHKSAIRLDEAIVVDLYDPLVETPPVSETGSVSWQGRHWHVGDAFAGQGEIGGPCPYGRIRPTAFGKRRSSRRIQAKVPEGAAKQEDQNG